MRVMLAVGHGGIYSGSAHQALYQLMGFRRLGVEVHAVWGDDLEGDPDGFSRLRALDIPFTLIPIHRRPTPESLRRFRRCLTRFRPDVLECMKSGAQYHALLAGAGLHDHALVFYRGVTAPMDFFQGLKYRLPRVDRIIANSAFLKKQMVRTGHIPADNIDVVPGEFDPACAAPEQVRADGLRTELGIPPDLPLVTLLGNWSPWRGQSVMLEAAHRLRARGVRFHLLFAGRQTDRLKPDVYRLDLQDCVTLSPYRRDPERLIRITDVGVVASTGVESLSGALLNFMAMGVPAAATRVGGTDEVISDGLNGLLVAPGDPEALADAVHKLLQLTPPARARMGLAARERAVNHFSSAVRTRARLESYQRALEHRRRRRRCAAPAPPP